MLRLVARSEVLMTGVSDGTRLNFSPVRRAYGPQRMAAFKLLASPVKTLLGRRPFVWVAGPAWKATGEAGWRYCRCEDRHERASFQTWSCRQFVGRSERLIRIMGKRSSPQQRCDGGQNTRATVMEQQLVQTTNHKSGMNEQIRTRTLLSS